MTGKSIALSSLLVIGLAAGAYWKVANDSPSVVDAAEARHIEVFGEAWLDWPFEEGVGRVYQNYGQGEIGNALQVHKGLDLAAPAGTPVYSPVSGVVSMNYGVSYDTFRQGIAIRTKYKDGDIFIKLLHLERASIQVLLGDHVQAGDFLGVLSEWPAGEVYEPHLHIEIGGAELLADMGELDGNIVLSGLDSFRAVKNPLQWVKHPTDNVVPQLVPLSGEEPLIFRQLTEEKVSAYTSAGPKLDPQALSGWVDIEFGVADGHSRTKPSLVMPHHIWLQIFSANDLQNPVLDRDLILEGPLNVATDYSQSIYLDPPKDWPAEHGFHMRLLSLRGLGGDAEDPVAWDTSKNPAGSYLIRIHASDFDNKNVLLGEFPVQVAAQ